VPRVPAFVTRTFQSLRFLKKVLLRIPFPLIDLFKMSESGRHRTVFLPEWDHRTR
jgi:hypothetical protein